jgi:hypothetical protein
MRRATLAITLPPPVIAAVDGEARRRLLSRSEVVEGALRFALPRALAADLGIPSVLDVEDEETNTTVPRDSQPEAPDHPLPYVTVASSLPPGDPEREAGIACAPG